MGVFLQKEGLRVLLLIDAMEIGGAETHVFTLAKALLRRGAEPCIVCGGGPYAEELKKYGIRMIHAPLRHRSLRGFFACARILRRIGREHFDAVHAHTRYTAVLASLFLRHIPLITTVHLNFSLSPFKRLLSRWGRCALAVSPDLADYLSKEYGYPRERIFLTKNGIDPSDFPLLPARGSCILHLSRLDRDRSLCAHTLCAIAPRLCQYAPQITIRIYGDGDDFRSVQAAAAAANARIGRKAVFLMGSTHCVFDALKDAAMVIGVSRVALESAAAAIPVILAGNDGYGGILTEEAFEKRKIDNFCCRKCKNLSADALFSDIIFLWTHRCYCENIRMKIAARVRQDFSADSMADDALSAYAAAQKIAIIGFYGYGNFGDERMLAAIKKALTLQGARRVYTLSPARGALCRRRPIRTLFRLRRCDKVILGGGNLLQSETSMRSLLYYALLLRACRRHRCIGVGMGIGAFHSKGAKRLCARLLPLFRSFCVRTENDAATALALAPRIARRLFLTCDPCLHLAEISDRKSTDAWLSILRREGSEETRALLAACAARGISVRPAVLFPKEDSAFWEKGEKKPRAEAFTVHTESDFFAAADGARLCISERLHGAVFSLLCHLPCLLYCESEKNQAFADDCKRAADRLGIPCPVLPYKTAAEAMEREKEAEGCTLGFSEMIRYFRTRFVRFED